MLEFAELEKESVFDEDSGECMVSIKYDEQNENEIIIRLLSFGPVVEVSNLDNISFAVLMQTASTLSKSLS